jgi:hypothetical protein
VQSAILAGVFSQICLKIAANKRLFISVIGETKQPLATSQPQAVGDDLPQPAAKMKLRINSQTHKGHNMDEDDFPIGTSERERAIRRRVHQLAEFYRHAMIFAVVNLSLWAINAVQIYLSTQSIKWYSWWAIWPMLGWGIGLLTHGITVVPVWTVFSQEWEDRKVKQLMERDQP